MKRAIDIGAVDAAAIKTVGGKIRLRLLFSVDQLEALLAAAREDVDGDAMQRNATQCNAREDETRSEVGDGGDARARPPPSKPAIDQKTRVFVMEGTRAWEAWMREKQRTTGCEWTLTSTQIIDGKKRTGWWFVSLFPSSEPELETPESTGSTK